MSNPIIHPIIFSSKSHPKKSILKKTVQIASSQSSEIQVPSTTPIPMTVNPIVTTPQIQHEQSITQSIPEVSTTPEMSIDATEDDEDETQISGSLVEKIGVDENENEENGIITDQQLAIPMRSYGKFEICTKRTDTIKTFNYNIICQNHFKYRTHILQIIQNKVVIEIMNEEKTDRTFSITYTAKF